MRAVNQNKLALLLWPVVLSWSVVPSSASESPQYPAGVRGSTFRLTSNQSVSVNDDMATAALPAMTDADLVRAGQMVSQAGDQLNVDTYIPAGGFWAVKFDPAGRSLQVLTSPAQHPLTASAQSAIDKAPRWLQNDLRHLLLHLPSAYQEKWAGVILTAQDPYIDEIAFCIAHLSPQYLMSTYASAQLLRDNARLIYENDKFLSYVKVVDYGSSTTDPDYYSTTRYRKAKYTDTTEVVVPRDIYYWYIVHPKLSDEIPAYIDPAVVEDNESHRNNITPSDAGHFWRDFLFYRSDPGYASIKDLLARCRIVWNAFASPPNATPPAMEMLSRWVSSSFTFTSNDERPHQPVRIYRKHIGRCGEYSDIRAAAARAALIPATCIASYSTDHVWNEFWEEKWIHWDEVINRPRIYVDEWKKKFGSVFQWRSDGVLLSVTPRYTHEHATLNIYAVDASNQPVDGAQVILYTAGLDNSLWFDTFGVTDANGMVSFTVGTSRNYDARLISNLETIPSGGGPPLRVATLTEKGQVYPAVLRLSVNKPMAPVTEKAAPLYDEKKYGLSVQTKLPAQIVQGNDLFDDLNQNAYQFVDRAGGVCRFIMMGESEYAAYLATGTVSGFHPVLKADSLALEHEFDGESSLIFLWDNSTAAHTAMHMTGTIKLHRTSDPSIARPAIVSFYPNPYNPVRGFAGVKMQLPQKGKVNVSVFNMIGQQVATAADGVFYAGAHTVNWDGRNTSGHPVPSGVYIVRCRTEQGESNKKILVLH
jgi:hypothetical protein